MLASALVGLTVLEVVDSIFALGMSPIARALFDRNAECEKKNGEGGQNSFAQ